MKHQGDLKLRLIVMRHGETSWNRLGRVQGTLDIPLNERGRVQVRRTTEKLVDSGFYSISQIVTSPLRRAKETALICQELLQVPLIEHADWRERSFGSLQGMTADEILQLYQIDDFEEIASGSQLTYSIESIDEITLRITRGLQRLMEQSISSDPGGHILLVTHGSIIKRLARLCGHEAGILPNAEFIELMIDKPTVTIS